MFTFMMNLSSNSSKENGKRKEKGYHCSYCEKAFENSQVLGDHQRLYEVEIKQDNNQMIHFQNSKDVTKSNPGHGDALMKALSRGTTNNPYVTKGNYYGGYSREDHNSLFMSPNYSSARTDNASLVTSIQYKETIPFSQSVDYPIYMSSFSNHIGGASSSINHQFDASNPQFFIDSFSKPFKSNFWKNEHNDPNLTYPVLVRNSSLPGYHMADFSFWNFNTNKFPSPIEPNVVDTQINFVGSNNRYSYNVDQIYEKVKNHYRDEVQEKIPMMNPPKKPNINFGPLVNHGIEMLQKKEAWFSTKETKLKAVEAIFGKDEGKNASTSKSANFIKEQEVDLDLSLHL
ncbi:uncharacterized protein LOC114425652 isoform X1 [Glycine soja]|uniref:C2H2-type domain-containing protein n=1 Tax=Glycine soja TaxID=3848 RepID=A0A445IWI9_GLYSO|nr:uncharacterized protein LOC114425652 isoform X1 [Glycine soja]RZB90439.1 hypothetical protein D0Y65_023062 [Glycine soja]